MNEADTNYRDELINTCWESAAESFGTAYIFDQRANRLKTDLRRLDFIGLAVPVAVGAIALSFGFNKGLLGPVILLSGVAGVFQLVGTVRALVYKWDEGLAYSVRSNVLNKRLSAQFRSLAKFPPQDIETLVSRFSVLEAEYISQSGEDEAQDLTPKERRMGMRAGLREFQIACASCKNVPTSMNKSDCDVCGNF